MLKPLCQQCLSTKAVVLCQTDAWFVAYIIAWSLIPKTNPGSRWLVLQAQNDDAQQPQVKDELRAAFAAAHRRATVEVYPATASKSVHFNLLHAKDDSRIQEKD